MLEIFGGPDRDRTDDLFHAMEAIKPQNTDGTVLMNRHNRQKRPNGRYLRAKCGQNLNQVANRLIVWNQPDFFFRASSKSSVSAKQTEGFGVLPPGMSGFLFGLESLDRFFGSLIGVHHGEAFVSEVPLKLGSNSELSSLR